jgi:hypothetical protein
VLQRFEIRDGINNRSDDGRRHGDLNIAGIVVDDVNRAVLVDVRQLAKHEEWRRVAGIGPRVITVQSLNLHDDSRVDGMKAGTVESPRELGWGSSAVSDGQLPDEMVEDTAVVVDAIPEDLAEGFAWERSEDFDEIPEPQILAVRVFLYFGDETIGLWLTPGGDELLEPLRMFVCPIEFQSNGIGQSSHDASTYTLNPDDIRWTPSNPGPQAGLP